MEDKYLINLEKFICYFLINVIFPFFSRLYIKFAVPLLL